MTELHEYHQYQCTECGFRVRSPNETELFEITQGHLREQHGLDRDRDAIREDLRLLELEGFPENS